MPLSHVKTWRLQAARGSFFSVEALKTLDTRSELVLDLRPAKQVIGVPSVAWFASLQQDPVQQGGSL